MHWHQLDARGVAHDPQHFGVRPHLVHERRGLPRELAALARRYVARDGVLVDDVFREDVPAQLAHARERHEGERLRHRDGRDAGVGGEADVSHGELRRRGHVGEVYGGIEYGAGGSIVADMCGRSQRGRQNSSSGALCCRHRRVLVRWGDGMGE